MTYYCNKVAHTKSLLTRKVRITGPSGDEDYLYIETCRECIEDAVRDARCKAKSILEAAFK